MKGSPHKSGILNPLHITEDMTSTHIMAQQIHTVEVGASDPFLQTNLQA